MSTYILAFALATLGALMIVIGRRKHTKAGVTAIGGSVSVGGNNNGNIFNTNANSAEPKSHGGEIWLMRVGIPVHLIGIALGCWEIYEKHFSGK